MNENKKIICQICKREKYPYEVFPGKIIKKSVVETIRRTFPHWSEDGFICITDLNHFRKEYLDIILQLEKGQLSKLDEDVVKSLKDEELISKNINNDLDTGLTLGQKIADKVATFGGSWRFIISFGIILLLWIVANTVILVKKSFDPYPFILLNLVLSCLAAIQAPIIMMSQNRQEEKDRRRSENDYKINLKAELEIRLLNEKIDYISREWIHLMETQQILTEMMEELLTMHKHHEQE